jgi:hypothetical protein
MHGAWPLALSEPARSDGDRTEECVRVIRSYEERGSITSVWSLHVVTAPSPKTSARHESDERESTEELLCFTPELSC